MSVPDSELHKDVAAYMATGGNRSAAARLRKLPRNSYRDRLKMAEKRFGTTLGKVVDGRMDYVQAVRRSLPKGKGVARYILSSCQNNTHPHKAGWANLLAYAAWLGARPQSTCEVILGSFSYQIDAYGAKAVKRNTAKPRGDELWYSPELVEFIHDESIQLAPGLVWCGEMNILPTASRPLVGMDDYNGRNSNIVPHVKHALESVPSLPDEAVKLNFTTGTVTLRNYIQKRVGIMAERKHTYGAVLVEVDSSGNWYVRQLTIDDQGDILDIGPSGFAGVWVHAGKVEARPIRKPEETPTRSLVEAITWGDIHAAEMDLAVRELGWGEGGMLDEIQPRKQFMHDVFSMRSRTHHEMKNFHRTYQKFVNDEGSVEDEMQVTADFTTESFREWCETIVVRSNHCRQLDRWLNEADPTRDPLNASYFYALQSQVLAAMDAGNRDFNVLEWALRKAGIPEGVQFLGEDESYVICKDQRGGIECGLHGDLGANGARGSTQGLTRLGRPANKAHDHTATIRNSVFSGGVCGLQFPYKKGPHTQSVSHIVTYDNGARTIVTFWAGKYRA